MRIACLLTALLSVAMSAQAEDIPADRLHDALVDLVVREWGRGPGDVRVRKGTRGLAGGVSLRAPPVTNPGEADLHHRLRGKVPLTVSFLVFATGTEATAALQTDAGRAAFFRAPSEGAAVVLPRITAVEHAGAGGSPVCAVNTDRFSAPEILCAVPAAVPQVLVLAEVRFNGPLQMSLPASGLEAYVAAGAAAAAAAAGPALETARVPPPLVPPELVGAWEVQVDGTSGPSVARYKIGSDASLVVTLDGETVLEGTFTAKAPRFRMEAANGAFVDGVFLLEEAGTRLTLIGSQRVTLQRAAP